MLMEKLVSVAQVGSQVVLWLLIALSLWSISVIVDRSLFFWRRRLDVPALGKRLSEALRRGDLPAAIAACAAAAPAVEAESMGEALQLYPGGFEAMAESMQGALRERRPGIESGLVFLGTLGNNAPFIGLFGTVLGIVTAFRELGSSAQGAMGNVMGGIAEALISTAVGILVALPAVVAYNVFQKRAADVEENLAALSNHVFAVMKMTPGSLPVAPSQQPKAGA
jgi:biopolymer transport protein ExbB/biopolymer transport protein TolQ